MNKAEFFDKQTDLTASKILIYKQYLKSYLPKVLMQYGRCYIIDLFCGPGKNGQEDGSPLVLIEIAKELLQSPILRRKHPAAEIIIVFSDDSNDYCRDLSENLGTISIPEKIKIYGPYCEDYDSIKTKVVQTFSKMRSPKFFFLDPFTYSNVSIDDVKEIMDITASEVLLFLPTFHSYRFVKCADKVGALKYFLESFTKKGCADYIDIIDFNESIRQRLMNYVNLKYVRSICLDDGAKKNALFYLTKHITGMLLMNNIVWQFAQDGLTVKAKRDKEESLFNLSTITSNFNENKEALENYIKEKKSINNIEIIDYVAQIGFPTKYAAQVLRNMKEQDLIEVNYLKKEKTRGFYVADGNWNKQLATIIYKGGSSNGK